MNKEDEFEVSIRLECLKIASQYVHNDSDLKKLAVELIILVSKLE